MHLWISEEHTYKGFPLYLRRVTDVDSAANRHAFPVLSVITHEFSQRLADGRPESDYNDNLADFDHDIVTAFDASAHGVPVLVETFAGKRHYYFYVSDEADVSSVVARLKSSYPLEQISSETRSDANWSFLTGYAKQLSHCI